MDSFTEEMLAHLGLDEREVTIYQTLLKFGQLTATELSQKSGIPKTSVYRHLRQLIKKNLVVENVGDNGRLFETAPLENLNFLANEKKLQAEMLVDSVPELLSTLSGIAAKNKTNSAIRFYQGLEGLKQVTWNSSRADGVLRIFEIESMSAFLNFNFAEAVRMEFVRNGVEVREISNENQINGWTNVTDMVNQWEVRYIPPEVLQMSFEIVIYNDVLLMYNYEKEIFCVEIQNEQLANMQRTIFDFMWSQAQKMKVLDEHGAAELA